MTKEELKREFLNVFLLVPTKEQVTSSQMKLMENLAEIFSNLSSEKAEIMLLFFQKTLSDPESLKKTLTAIGATQDNLTELQNVIALLESSMETEKKRAN